MTSGHLLLCCSYRSVGCSTDQLCAVVHTHRGRHYLYFSYLQIHLVPPPNRFTAVIATSGCVICASTTNDVHHLTVQIFWSRQVNDSMHHLPGIVAELPQVLTQCFIVQPLL